MGEARELFGLCRASKENPLQQNFTVLADELQDQLKGLNARDIDTFIMEPMQAFQQWFNDTDYQVLTQENQQSGELNQSTLSSLINSRKLSLAISALLAGLLLPGAGLLRAG